MYVGKISVDKYLVSQISLWRYFPRARRSYGDEIRDSQSNLQQSYSVVSRNGTQLSRENEEFAATKCGKLKVVRSASNERKKHGDIEKGIPTMMGWEETRSRCQKGEFRAVHKRTQREFYSAVEKETRFQGMKGLKGTWKRRETTKRAISFFNFFLTFNSSLLYSDVSVRRNSESGIEEGGQSTSEVELVKVYRGRNATRHYSNERWEPWKSVNIYHELDHVDSLSFSRTNTTRPNKFSVSPSFVRPRLVSHPCPTVLVPLKARARTARRNKRTRRPRSG